MKFTEEERKIAAQLTKSKDTMALIEKIFTPDDEAVEAYIQKETITKADDAEFGRMMKVAYLSKQAFHVKMEQLKALGKHQGDKKAAIAPK